MTSILKKIMSIVRKTGDRCIIFDELNSEAFVLMNLDSYESILSTGKECLTDLKENDIIKPVNSEVNNAKTEDADDLPFEELGNLPETVEDKILEDERFYLEPIE